MAITKYEIKVFGGTNGHQQDRARITLSISRIDLTEVTMHFREGALPLDSYPPGQPQHFDTYQPLSMFASVVEMLLEGGGLDFDDWMPPQGARTGVLILSRTLTSRGGAGRKAGKAAEGAARKGRSR